MTERAERREERTTGRNEEICTPMMKRFPFLSHLLIFFLPKCKFPRVLIQRRRKKGDNGPSRQKREVSQNNPMQDVLPTLPPLGSEEEGPTATIRLCQDDLRGAPGAARTGSRCAVRNGAAGASVLHLNAGWWRLWTAGKWMSADKKKGCASSCMPTLVAVSEKPPGGRLQNIKMLLV